LQTPGRILRLRGTRAQYSNDNKNELHGGIPAFAPDETPYNTRLSGRRVHGRSPLPAALVELKN
jgi:hypothetical protein